MARAGYTPGRLRAESPGTAAALAGEADYDLLVLGAGSAAFAAAIRGRDAGFRVALAEAGTLGGTCVNVGCVPFKALLAAGAAYWAAGHHRFAGITTSAGRVDLAALIAQKDDLVDACGRRSTPTWTLTRRASRAIAMPGDLAKLGT